MLRVRVPSSSLNAPLPILGAGFLFYITSSCIVRTFFFASQETMRQTQRLAQGIQHQWLISGSVEPDAAGKRIRPEDVGGGGQ